MLYLNYSHVGHDFLVSHKFQVNIFARLGTMYFGCTYRSGHWGSDLFDERPLQMSWGRSIWKQRKCTIVTSKWNPTAQPLEVVWDVFRPDVKKVYMLQSRQDDSFLLVCENTIFFPGIQQQITLKWVVLFKLYTVFDQFTELICVFPCFLSMWGPSCSFSGSLRCIITQSFTSCKVTGLTHSLR